MDATKMHEPEKLIPPHGGYRKLKSFQVAQLAYDVTVRFCGDRFIDPPPPKSCGAARRPPRMASVKERKD